VAAAARQRAWYDMQRGVMGCPNEGRGDLTNEEPAAS
jgi:hypothetical protein